MTKLFSHAPLASNTAAQTTIPVPHGTSSLLIRVTLLASATSSANIGVSLQVAPPPLPDGTPTFAPSKQSFPNISAAANAFVEGEVVMHFGQHPAALDGPVGFVRVTTSNSSASAAAAVSVHVENLSLQ